MVMFAGLTAASWAAEPEEAHYNTVITLYNAGQWDAALKKIKERENQPMSDELHSQYEYAKGLALEKSDRTDEAETVYQALLKKYPAFPEAGKARTALIYIRYGKSDFDAITNLFPSVNQGSLNPTDKTALALMQAESLAAKSNAPAAMQAFDNALKLGADKNLIAGRLFQLYYQFQKNKELLALSASGVTGLAPDMVAAIRSESMLATGLIKDAQQEASKVPKDSAYYTRACFVQAQALIKQGNLKDAVDPLRVAIQGFKDPPAPASAYLSLAECLLEAGRPDDAASALADAERLGRAMPENERKPFMVQIALTKVRSASAGKDMRKLESVIVSVKADMPPEKLPELLYMRLYALKEIGDWEGILETMPQDLAVFKGRKEEGPAVLIYGEALKTNGKNAEAAKMYEEYVSRCPDSADSFQTRVWLANEALARDDFACADIWLDQIIAKPDAKNRIGAATYAEVVYNRSVVAIKTNNVDASIRLLEQLVQSNPSAELSGKALFLLGHAYGLKNNFKQAAVVWQKALVNGKGFQETELRERLGKALFAANDFRGAAVQFEALAKLSGATNSLMPESRETWARAFYNMGSYSNAAVLYASLHGNSRDRPVYAYECAVCWERAAVWREAEAWYLLADKDRNKLPSDYMAALDANLARVRQQGGLGDGGMSFNLTQLAPTVPEPAFQAAVASLVKPVQGFKPDDNTIAVLEAAIEKYPPETSRRYAVGAVLIRMLSARGRNEDIRKWCGRLLAEFASHEKELVGKGFAGTVAPAMIYFYKGEAERLAGNGTDALVAYETVLSVYPYNEWPDAAVCGIAECYAALGDKKTALSKFAEVIQIGGQSPASSGWVALAKRRTQELTKGE